MSCAPFGTKMAGITAEFVPAWANFALNLRKLAPSWVQLGPKLAEVGAKAGEVGADVAQVGTRTV